MSILRSTFQRAAVWSFGQYLPAILVEKTHSCSTFVDLNSELAGLKNGHTGGLAQGPRGAAINTDRNDCRRTLRKRGEVSGEGNADECSANNADTQGARTGLELYPVGLARNG